MRERHSRYALDCDIHRQAVSTATPFKFLGAFPFCAEEMTTAAITALGFAAYRGTLADVMEKFWLVETVALNWSHTVNGDADGGTYYIGGENFIYDHPATFSIAPRDRVCRSTPLPDSHERADYGPLGTTAWPYPTNGVTTAAIRMVFRRVVLDTDTGEYCLLFSINLAANDLGNTIITTDQANPDCTGYGLVDSVVFGVTVPTRYKTSFPTLGASDKFSMTADFDTFFSF